MKTADAEPKVGILSGPTATGKTAIALEFARTRPNLEIINADSLLVYRHLRIGTAKPTEEELAEIPHHLIDIREPDESFTAGDFVRLVHDTVAEIHGRRKRALIVGGTGFYLKALLFGLWEGPATHPELRAQLQSVPNEELYRALESRDPESALRIGVNDRYRLIRAIEIIQVSGKTPSELQAEQNTEADPRFRVWIVDREKVDLESRILARTRQMMDQGLIEETQSVRSRFPNSRALQSVGYAQVSDFLDGISPEGRKAPVGIEGLLEEITLATRQLVKSQRTWFRGQFKDASSWFTLDTDRERLLQEMKTLYGHSP